MLMARQAMQIQYALQQIRMSTLRASYPIYSPPRHSHLKHKCAAQQLTHLEGEIDSARLGRSDTSRDPIHSLLLLLLGVPS